VHAWHSQINDSGVDPGIVDMGELGCDMFGKSHEPIEVVGGCNDGITIVLNAYVGH